MFLLLTILAVLLGVYGVIRIAQGDILWGIILVVLALLVGPGGISIFT